MPANHTEQFTPASAGAAYLQNPPPDYPPEARRNGEEGSVVLRVEVNAQGRPENVGFRQRSGYRRLDEAARQAVLRWRFIPAQRNGQPVADTADVTLTFRLTTGAAQ
ncbi:energy transducer TonB [Chitinilyticum piscinae]|uniref:Energy transducer TonB n=1 Tax=Chitinilyticum piscinae TaxID=2866724 RepID=A0A8J7K2Y4_9NEIS|nr:energy transducer TonB [Chitinilyticum piscinae]MBE9610627.1 energy transducer TonB [Chitinilyticum piscinae]